MDETIERQTKKAIRPASLWRNRYRALHDFTDISGRSYRAGQEYWGTKEWPSRDTAETYGWWWEVQPPCDVGKYLGAFPME